MEQTELHNFKICKISIDLQCGNVASVMGTIPLSQGWAQSLPIDW